MREDRSFLFGVAFLAAVAGIVGLTVALYDGSFRHSATVTLKSARAGLTMDTGAPVKLRGVEVGKVSSVEPDADGALIRLSLDPGQLAHIPADIGARIVPPTAFGAKYVELLLPRGTHHGPTIRAGAVIEADHVTVEVNEAFSQLAKVLDVAKPAEVNAALTALAGTLDQRGDQIGDLVTKADNYLATINPSLPTLTTDLRRSTSVLDTYNAAMPDLLSAVARITTTASTVSSQQASLQAMLVSLRSFSHDTDEIVTTNRADLAESLKQLAPVSDVLAKYSPELPCVIWGVVVQKRAAEKAVGGTNPGITVHTRIQPADEPYRYPYDLPEIGDTRGPNCYGLPAVTATTIREDPPFETGTDPYQGGASSFTKNLADTFFGNLAGLLNLAEVNR